MAAIGTRKPDRGGLLGLTFGKALVRRPRDLSFAVNASQRATRAAGSKFGSLFGNLASVGRLLNFNYRRDILGVWAGNLLWAGKIKEQVSYLLVAVDSQHPLRHHRCVGRSQLIDVVHCQLDDAFPVCVELRTCRRAERRIR